MFFSAFVVMAGVGFALGAVEGMRVSRSSLITGRLETGAWLGAMWASNSVMLPFAVATKCERAVRGYGHYEALGIYKSQRNLAML